MPTFVFAGGNALLLEKIGTFRGSPLHEIPLLCSIAKTRLAEIQDSFSHAGLYRYSLSGYVAENLARGYDTSDEVLAAWKASLPHRVNMYGDYDFGCVRHENGYWVFVAWHV